MFNKSKVHLEQEASHSQVIALCESEDPRGRTRVFAELIDGMGEIGGEKKYTPCHRQPLNRGNLKYEREDWSPAGRLKKGKNYKWADQLLCEDPELFNSYWAGLYLEVPQLCCTNGSCIFPNLVDHRSPQPPTTKGQGSFWLEIASMSVEFPTLFTQLQPVLIRWEGFFFSFNHN